MATNSHHVLWERLYVAPPPTEPPCKYADPRLFDIAHYTGVNVMRRDGAGPNSSHADRIGVALRYCATCPLATRAWCVNAVQPQPAGFSGVAGGVVWSNGRRVWDVERQQRLVPEQRQDGAA